MQPEQIPVSRLNGPHASLAWGLPDCVDGWRFYETRTGNTRTGPHL